MINLALSTSFALVHVAIISAVAEEPRLRGSGRDLSSVSVFKVSEYLQVKTCV